MKPLAYLAWFASAVALAFAQDTKKTPNSAADQAARRAVDAGHEAFVAAMRANDVEALVKLQAPDMIFYPPNAAPLVGTEALRRWYQSVVDQVRTTGVSVTNRSVTITGDRAIEEGQFTWAVVPRAGGTPTEDRGQFMAIWQRQADGSWKATRDIWNSSLPAPAAATAGAGDAGSRYLTISYLKTEPGKAAEYVRLVREMWKAIHQDMVNRGRITSWKLYAVSWPNGEGEEYDFVAMMEYPSFGHLESPYTNADMIKALGGQGRYDELMAKTPVVRQLRRTDTTAILAATSTWSATTASRVMSVHYLSSLPGKGGDLMKIQREYFLPSNEELVKAGIASGWATTGVRYPTQLNGPYDYVSFNAYESFTQMDKEPPQAWIDAWRAKGTEANRQLPTIRKRVKGQLWRLIEQTEPRQTVAAQ